VRAASFAGFADHREHRPGLAAKRYDDRIALQEIEP